MRPLADARIAARCHCVLLLSVLILELDSLLIPNDKLENQAVIQFERTEIIEGRRGNILDPRALATCEYALEHALDPSLLRAQDVDELVDHLGLFLSIDRLKDISNSANNSRWLIVRQQDSLSPLRLDL